MSILGTYTASLTPFHNDYSINDDLFFNHCNNLLNQGSDGIVIFGTTGEASLISVKNKMKSLESLVAKGFDPSILIPGTGLSSLKETIELSKFAKKLNVSGILVLPSCYYNNLTNQGVIDYYSNIVDSVCDENFQVLLYHIPQISGVHINHEIISNLIKKYPKNIVGMKDSENNLDKMLETIKNFPGFKVFSGSDSLALNSIKAGGAGAITATANVSVALLSFIVKNATKEEMTLNLNKAHDLQDKIRKVVFSQEQISFMKAYMGYKNSNDDWNIIMPPLIKMNNVGDNKNIKELSKLLIETENLLSSF